jgi:Flp pilus assembly protein TadG
MISACLTFLVDRGRSLLARRDGNVAITFAIALVPLVGLAGAAVDYSRATNVRAKMQAALDSTALMLSRTAASLTPAELQQSATSYFSALFDGAQLTAIAIKPSYDAARSTLTVAGSGGMATNLLGVVGIHQLDVATSATVTWSMTRLRVALALDNTGSMNDNGKLAALKTASRQLLAKLQAAAQNPGDVQVAIVPFTTDVNIGTAFANATWIDWGAWNEGGSIQNGMACSATSSSTSSSPSLPSWLSFFFGFGPPQGWPPASTTAWGGLSLASPFSASCGGSTRSGWNGCVMDRSQPFDASNAVPVSSNSATLFPADQSAWCPQELMPLSSNWTALNSKIDAMVASGATNQTIGLAWAWQALTPGGPLNVPALPPDTRQVIILLTDGLNTQNRWSLTQSEIDARTQAACNGIRAAGITLYTVLVMSGDSSILRSCASDPGKYFALTQASQMVSTFDDIGTALSQLRIAR